MFRPELSHHQGAKNCTKNFFGLPSCSEQFLADVLYNLCSLMMGQCCRKKYELVCCNTETLIKLCDFVGTNCNTFLTLTNIYIEPIFGCYRFLTTATSRPMFSTGTHCHYM